LLGARAEAEISVGIYDAGRDVHKPMKVAGGKGIGDPISKEPDISVSYTGEITVEEMMKYDVFVVAPADMGAETAKTYGANIQAYVAAGGNVILTYVYMRALPSVCEFRGESWFWKGVKTKKWLGQVPPLAEPVGEHPVLKGIEKFEPVHKHFILSAPGKDGTVVLKDQMGRAFATVGEVGLGKALSIGSCLGKTAEPWPKDPDIEISGAELKLVLNTVRWMGKRVPPDKQKLLAVLQKRAESLKALGDEYARKLTALCDELRKASADAKELGEAQALVEESKTKPQEVLTTAMNSLETAKDAAPAMAEAMRSLVELQGTLGQGYLEKCLAVLDARRKATLDAKTPFGRKFPRYPRGFYHPEASLGNVVRASPASISSFLKEMTEEAHANYITSAAQRYEAKAKWVPPEQLHNFFLLCELHGMAALPCYHFGILDRGWNGAEEALAGYAKYPAFAGLMIDEPKYTPYHGAWGSSNPDATMDFRGYLKDRFSKKKLMSYGVEDPDAVSIASVGEARKNQFVWSMVGQYSREKIAGWMGRDMKYVRSLGGDLLATMDLQGLGYPVWYSTLAPLGGGYICCEPYDRASFKQVYISELLRGCTGGKVWKFMAPSLHYAWHNDTQYRRGMFQAMAHNDGIGIFLYAWVAKRMTSWSGSRKAWQPTFWPITCEMYGLMEKLEDFIADTQSYAQVAVLVSENSMWNNHYGEPFNHELQTIFTSLCTAAHVPTDFVFLDLLAESKTRDRLPRYKVLISAIADSMSDEEAQIIRDWVKAGGVLLAAGGTSLCDKYGIQREDYALGEVLGAKFVKRHSLEGKGNMSPKEGSPLEESMEYTPPAKTPKQYDVVSPLPGALVQAAWEGNEAPPAVLTNSYGTGAAAFVSAPYPGIGSKPAGQLLAQLVSWGLAQSKTEPNLVLEDCPSNVDATVRVAQEGRTLVLHLTSYRGQVAGAKAKVRAPWSCAPSRVKDFIGDRDLEHSVDGPYVCFDVPDFEIHTMVAISQDQQFESEAP